MLVHTKSLIPNVSAYSGEYHAFNSSSGIIVRVDKRNNLNSFVENSLATNSIFCSANVCAGLSSDNSTITPSIGPNCVRLGICFRANTPVIIMLLPLPSLLLIVSDSISCKYKYSIGSVARARVSTGRSCITFS
ncbi:hypothetical protein DERF_010544 [Dermatophagoides farinae]|uniref:Uncharacterized protein n=1 Tax=Dermatophagoides farinae TaxID=6954 RepID=A0A922I1K2_DERFA|nr:hypothetical protein DERF_010544 [Dermatophagoides farinae]